MILVKYEQNANGAHENQTSSVKLDGWLVMPDDLVTPHFPFFTIEEVDEDGVITAITDGEFPPVPAEDIRRYAYEHDAVIEYEGKLITVDEARNICLEYFFESTERAQDIVDELTQKITDAKEQIRGRDYGV